MEMFVDEIIGGLLIGVSSAFPLLWEGRIAGVSGYASNLIQKDKNTKNSRALVLGIVLGGFAAHQVFGAKFTVAVLGLPIWVWALAGLLVGFGSRLGGGCTSGHGVCGLGRASFRSLISVLTFMFFGVLTAVLMRVWS